jgi:DNA-binding transcriptional LysR family regulator
MTFDLDQLRTFLLIAETGSFTRAAQLAGRTQSALSAQIALLEGRLGHLLFAREGRGCRLTEEGQRLAAHAREMVRLSDRAVAAFGSTGPAQIVFGIPDDYAPRFLPRILERAAAVLPGTEISLVCEISDRLAEIAWSGGLDVAIATNGSPALYPVIREEPLVWVASAAHAVEDEPVLPLVLSGPSCLWRRYALTALSGAGRRYRVAYVSTSAAVTAATVLQGLAVGVFTESAVRAGMRVLGRAEGFPALPSNQIGLVRSWRRPWSPAIDTFCDEITAALRGPLPQAA